MRSALVIVVLAACGGAKGTPGPGNEAMAIPATPCPADDELPALADGAWKPATGAEQVWCQAVRVSGERRWWIAGYAHEPGADEGSPHFALVAPNGNVVWTLAQPYDEFYPEGSGSQAADLDGDGTDEVVYSETWGEGGSSNTALIVAGVGAGEPKFARADLGWSDGDNGCTADWTITGGLLVITGEGECAQYAGKFRWDGSTLVTP